MGIDGDAPDPPRRRFGEEGGLLPYGGCLRLPEPVDRQRPQPAAPGEQPFITTHQVGEPWCELPLNEPEPVRSAMFAGEDELALPRRRLADPTLWDADLTALSQRGLPVSGSEITDSPPAVARGRGSHDDLWRLAEDLLTHDETAALWRMRHVRMAGRRIGAEPGTGGSAGAPCMRGRTRPHYFPLLWELRAWL